MTGSFIHSHKISTKHFKKVIVLSFKAAYATCRSLSYTAKPHIYTYSSIAQQHVENVSNTHYIQKLPLVIRKKAIVLTMIAIPLSSGAGIGAIASPSNEITDQPIAKNGSVIELSENIIIAFDAPVADKDYREAIIIYPQHSALAKWNDTHSELTITPQVLWEEQTTYILTLPSGNYDNGDPIIQTAISFETEALPAVSATYPLDDQKDFYLLPEEGLNILFNRGLRNHQVDFIVTPSLSYDVHVSQDRSSFTLSPLEELKDDTTYTVTIYADLREINDRKPHPIDQFSFTTLPQQPTEWPEDFNERLSAIKRFTIPQITKGKYIDVNLEAQVTTLFHDGDYVASFVDSTGTDAEPTPTGTFEIYNKDDYALSNMYQVYLPFWMAFTPDGLYGFHDLPIWPVGHEERPEGGTESLASIGRQASPGCVRHDTDDSQTLFEWADIGTAVVIY